MTLKYFNVKNGLTTGNITLNSSNSNVAANYFTGTGVVVTGNVSSGNANLGNAATANFFIGDGGLLSNITTAGGSSITNGNSNVVVNANSNVTVSVNGTSNIATFATTGLDISGNLIVGNVSNLGNVGNVKITGGSANQYLQTDGSGNLTWSTVSGGSGLNTITVDTFTGNGVQTSFTLSVSPTNVNDTTVNYNGATLLRNSYTISGANIDFSSAPANGAEIEVTTVQLAASGSGSFTTRTYTGNGTEANYTVTTGTTASSAIVALDGVVQVPTTDYTIANTTLTFATPPANSVGIQIRELGVAVSTTSVTTGKAIAMAIVFGF